MIFDAFNTFGEKILTMQMRPDSATHLLAELINNPAKSDAQIFRDAIQDDTAGSGSKKLLDGWLPARQVLS